MYLKFGWETSVAFGNELFTLCGFGEVYKKIRGFRVCPQHPPKPLSSAHSTLLLTAPINQATMIPSEQAKEEQPTALALEQGFSGSQLFLTASQRHRPWKCNPAAEGTRARPGSDEAKAGTCIREADIRD